MAQESDTQGQIRGHLQMIEQAYDLTITNKDEICGWIMDATHNSREVLTVALAINNRVAVHNPGRTRVISRTVVDQIIAGTAGCW